MECCRHWRHWRPLVLADSVWDGCQQVVPVQPNREPLSTDLVGERVLQGGFGSLDGSYDFSPVRYWSLVEVSDLPDELHVEVSDIGQGFPTYGDSGSGLLRRFPDGSLRNRGMASSGLGTTMRFARTDVMDVLLDAVVTPTLLCGPVDELGTCRDDVRVRCDAQGFWSDDCREEGLSCVQDDTGASCQCACDDEGPACQPGCDCDPDCPCDCDVGDGRDSGCACDPQCAGVHPDGGDGDPEAASGCAFGGGRGDGPDPAGWGWLLLIAGAAQRWRRRR